jgi:hypothetical protein
VRRQGHDAGKSGAIEDKGAAGQARNSVRTLIVKIIVEERLNARVRGAEVVAQKAILGFVIAEQGAGEVEELGLGSAAADGLS